MNRKPITNNTADRRIVSEDDLFDLSARLESCSIIILTIGAGCEDMNPCSIGGSLSGAADLLDYITKDLDALVTAAPSAGKGPRA